MSLLISCQAVSKSFGSRILFEDLSLSIFSGDRIGVIGPNGAGKSTFMKILAGKEKIDAGSYTAKKDLKVGYVAQKNEFERKLPEEILVEAISESFHLQDYEKHLKAQIWLSKLGFEKQAEIVASDLSGGWKKRLAIAVSLINEPDVLLLDEPTNHLDLEGILWLEKFLMKEASTFLMISHDRYVLEHLTNKMVEINPLYPKGLFAVSDSYFRFLEKKELFIEGQLEQERSIAGKAKRELDWVRTSPKARTTKSQARLDAAEEIFKKHQDLKKRNTQKKASIEFEASERQTRQLVVMKSLKMELGGRVLFKDLNLTLSPGVRLGLMGPNGSGKTTLLKIIAKELTPSQGTIKFADDLKIVYFDQHRNKLAGNTTLKEALAPNGDHVYYQGRPIHVSGWCKRFLFSPDLLDMPIEKLSGGERARIAIARLMLEPADVLLLDEPTNDLDITTLETLEETLSEFVGAVVLITHDRCMLDRLCNLFLGLGEENHVDTFAEYAQWEEASVKRALEKKQKKEEKIVSTADLAKKNKTLSYKDKRELEMIEKKMEELEASILKSNQLLSEPSTLENPALLTKICKEIDLLQHELDTLYERWAELQSF